MEAKDDPRCEDCGVVMERYEDSSDTGKGGWSCPECGWSMDDAPPPAAR